MKVGLSRPDRPNDAGQFVREGDRGLVVAAAGGHGDGPVLQACEALRMRAGTALCGQQHCWGPVREQAPQIDQLRPAEPDTVVLAARG